MDKTLFIIRGLPGSGKSTLADALYNHHDGIAWNEQPAWLEADQYFIQADGTYAFVPEQLHKAHTWCKEQAEAAMKHGSCCVIVSNTFTEQWEAQDYIEAAKKYGYLIQVIECHGNFGSIHNVPAGTLEKMKRRWQPTEKWEY